MFRTNFLKLKFWKSLSNFQGTSNLEKVNLLSNANANPQNVVANKKNVYQQNFMRNTRFYMRNTFFQLRLSVA